MARWRESCDPCPNHLPIRRFLQHVVAAYTPDRSGTLAGNRAADQEARPFAGSRPRSRLGPANDRPVFSRIDDLPGWGADFLSASALRFYSYLCIGVVRCTDVRLPAWKLESSVNRRSLGHVALARL